MEQGDFAYAARVRDVVRKIADQRIAETRPKEQVGTVDSVSATGLMAMVLFAGEVTPVPVRCGVFRPLPTSVVLVGGEADYRRIVDVLSGPYSVSALGLSFTSSWTTAPDPNFKLSGIRPGYSIQENRYAVSPEGTVHWHCDIVITSLAGVALGFFGQTYFQVHNLPLPLGPPTAIQQIVGQGRYFENNGFRWPLQVLWHSNMVDNGGTPTGTPGLMFSAMVGDQWDFAYPTVGQGEPNFVIQVFERIIWRVSYEVG